MEAGKDVPDDVLQERINDLAPNKCCTLIYTVSSSFDFVLSSWQFIIILFRASGRSRKKKSNFTGFLGANSRKKRPISREFSRPVSLKNDW